MKFAFVMPCWPRTEERIRLANECFASLLRTEPIGTTPLLFILWKPGPYVYPLEALRKKFWTIYWQQAHEGRILEGVDQPAVYGMGVAVEYGADYLVILGEDSLFHPQWLRRLVDLIERHPEARAWSVYRSAHVAIHRTLEERGSDVLVRSINGNGLCVSAVEWHLWGLHWTQGTKWPSPDGTTMDMHHLTARPGERWVTKESYMEHTGRTGAHAHPGVPEYAQNFLGVGG